MSFLRGPLARRLEHGAARSYGEWDNLAMRFWVAVGAILILGAASVHGAFGQM